MPAGKPIARELRTGWSSAQISRHILSQAERLADLGYAVEQHTQDTAVLARRYTPTAAWAVPAAIAILALLAMIANPPQGAESGGVSAQAVIFWLAVLSGVGFSLTAKITERVSISAEPAAPSGSRVLVSGSATPGLLSLVESWGEAVDGRRG